MKALRYDGVEMPPREALRSDYPRLRSVDRGGSVRSPRRSGAKPERTIDIEEGARHWAFQPVADPAPLRSGMRRGRTIRSTGSCWRGSMRRTWKPVGDADRVHGCGESAFDLTRLPPSPEEIERFLSDDSPRAYEVVVDRLLDSRALWRAVGSALARPDGVRRSGRDVEQRLRRACVAVSRLSHRRLQRRQAVRSVPSGTDRGDLLTRLPLPSGGGGGGGRGGGAANLVATGFLVLGDVEIVNPDKLKMETDHIDQQVNKIGQTFMGMTLGCVRCRDHKFDPIGVQDYYGIAGMLRSTVSTRRIPNGIWSGIQVVDLPETPEQTTDRERRTAEHKAAMDRLQAERAELEKEQAAIEEQLKQPEADKDGLTRKRDEIAGRLRGYPGRITHATFFAPTVPKAFGVQDAAQVGDMPIYIRGNPYAPGATVPRGVMRVAAWSESPSRSPRGRAAVGNWPTGSPTSGIR